MPDDAEGTPATETRTTAATALASLALFVLLAIAHTWPLASEPGILSRNDTGDTVLHEWILAWDAHQIVTDPIHLFDANIFYPERSTLAYSDPLFVQGMMAAPVIWGGGSPVLAYNLVLIAGFALTGWAMCLVVRRWTGSWPAGFLSGSLVAFNSFTMTRLPQVQDQHLEFFPLALFALDRLLVAPRVRHALQLAGWYVLQALTGQYLLVFTTISLVAAVAARPREWLGPRFWRVAWCAALAGAVAVAALLPFLLPYWSVSRGVGLVRSLNEAAIYSAHLDDYHAAPGRLYLALWPQRSFLGLWLFPGVTALALTALAIGTGIAIRDRRARMAMVVALVAFALSFGPAFAPYRWLYRVFPLLTGIRGADRFGQIVLACVAILAGFGLAAAERRLHLKWASALAVVLILTANAEAWRAPIAYERYGGIPPVYDALKKVGNRAVLAFFPFYGAAQFHLNTRYMLVSTLSFTPMLNGYSGFRPPSYYRHAEALASFPDQRSIQYLRDAGVTHVLVDGRLMRPSALARVADFPELKLWVTDGNLNIYLLTSER